MNRREFLAVAAATALAGCSSDTDDATTTGSRSTSLADSETKTTAESRSTTTADSGVPREPRSTTTGSSSASLDVQSQADEAYDLLFMLQVPSTGHFAYEKQRTVEPGDAFSLDSHLSAGTTYRLTVLASGETLVEITVSPDEAYDLVVKQGPKIAVER